MARTVNIDGDEFHKGTCYKCGVSMIYPKSMDRHFRQKGRAVTFYCINGHGQAYTESEYDKMRLERDQLRQRLSQKDDHIAHQRRERERAERSAAAYKGQVTKIKNRTKNGVCPCCNRHFENLERHMKGQHPDWDPDSEADAPTKRRRRSDV